MIIMISSITFAQKKERQVADAVQSLRKAMIDGDRKALEMITDDDLSYGHSSGRIENRTEFIDNIVSGRSDFVTMELTNQSILIEDKTAIVRHELKGEINDNNKPGTVHLLVMLVWVKDDGRWKLLARQAVKKQ
jgi:hypothetical protein